MRDPYAVLGVDTGADADTIKRAYRRLAHEYHPDKHPNDARAEERFKEVTAAYELLSDPETRSKYDHYGPAGFSSAGTGTGFGSHVNEIIQEFMSGFQGRRSPRGAGTDREITLKVTLPEVALGVEKTVRVSKNERCITCAGTGAASGTAPQICPTCGGRGRLTMRQGFLNMGKQCAHCRGRGKLIANPCPDCRGEGTIARQTDLLVRVPPGSEDGTVLRYAGQGHRGDPGASPGDLRVILHVESHPWFRRDGADIRCNVPIPLHVAALGGTVEVPTLEGTVKMKIPEGTQSDDVFRLAGKGAYRAGQSTRGDQHVTVKVEIPRHLSAEQQRLLQKLAEEPISRHYEAVADFSGRLERR